MIQIWQEHQRERCEVLAEYLIQHKTTVRETAARYGISKSTVHKDITEKLQKINPDLFEDAKQILAINQSERHLRGGEATKQKYRRCQTKIPE